MALPRGAELGATNDPKALIVGDKAAVAEQATAALDEQRRIGKLLEMIEGLAVPSWEGGFGKIGYITQQAQEVGKFEAYRDTLKQVGTNLNTYADALGTAQNRAQDAIDKWNEGEAATKKALADHNAAVDGYNAVVDAHNAAVKSGQTVPPIGISDPGEFVDPGEAIRKEAQEILADAREQLDHAGATAVKPPRSSDGGSGSTGGDADSEGWNWKWFQGGKAGNSDAGRGSGFDPRDLSNEDYDKHGWHRDYGDRDSEDGESEGGRKGLGVSGDVSLVKGGKGGELFKAGGESEGQVGDLKGKAKGSVDFISGGVGGEVKAGPDGVAAAGQAHFHVAHAEGEASADYGPIGVNAKGEAYVGGEARASVGIGKDGIHAGGEAFAGAKVTGEVGGDVGGVGGNVEAEAWAGVGVAADFDAGMKDGKFTIGGELGAGLGVGAKIGPNVTLDFPEMAESGKDLAKDAGKVVDKVTVSPGEMAGAGKSIVKGVGGLFS